MEKHKNPTHRYDYDYHSLSIYTYNCIYVINVHVWSNLIHTLVALSCDSKLLGVVYGRNWSPDQSRRSRGEFLSSCIKYVHI